MPSTPNGSGNKTETKEGRSTGLIANHVKSENDTDTNTKNSNSSGDSITWRFIRCLQLNPNSPMFFDIKFSGMEK